MRAYGRTLFELIYHKTPIYAVDRQPLFCTFCARAQNVSKQSCHLGPSGPNGKIREKITLRRYTESFLCVVIQSLSCNVSECISFIVSIKLCASSIMTTASLSLKPAVFKTFWGVIISCKHLIHPLEIENFQRWQNK